MTDDERSAYHARVAELNDALRFNLNKPSHNRVMITVGVQALIENDKGDWATAIKRQRQIMGVVASFSDFREGDDPYCERDFGAFDFAGVRCLWKIDYYDREVVWASPDATDPAVTCRVLTVMRSDEY